MSDPNSQELFITESLLYYESTNCFMGFHGDGLVLPSAVAGFSAISIVVVVVVVVLLLCCCCVVVVVLLLFCVVVLCCCCVVLLLLLL